MPVASVTEAVQAANAAAACVAAGFPHSLCSGAQQLALMAKGLLAHPSTSRWAVDNFGRGSEGESIGPMLDQRVIAGLLVLMPLAEMLLIRCIWEAFMRYYICVQRAPGRPESCADSVLHVKCMSWDAAVRCLMHDYACMKDQAFQVSLCFMEQTSNMRTRGTLVDRSLITM